MLHLYYGNFVCITIMYGVFSLFEMSVFVQLDLEVEVWFKVWTFVRGRNVFNLLARREISPRTKHIPKRNWGEASRRKAGSSSGSQSETARDSKRGLLSWYSLLKMRHFIWKWSFYYFQNAQILSVALRVEAESLRHLSAKYCPLVPPPRSTIAAAFSPDGRTLASTQ